MRFLITRTSEWGDGKPCEEAYAAPAIFVDRRTVPTIKEAKKRFWFKNWYEGGTNHREENGMIACDRPPRNKWFVEIDNLDDLVEFIHKHGRVVISSDSHYKDEAEIEIYDDYRE